MVVLLYVQSCVYDQTLCSCVFCVYLAEKSGVIVFELCVMSSRNSDISTKLFFPNL